MIDKLEVPRRNVLKNWFVGLNPDPIDRSHPDVHDDLLVQEAMMSRKSSPFHDSTAYFSKSYQTEHNCKFTLNLSSSIL